ncbi:MAG: rRNA maturation RNase YbeY [Flavobacteriales bacterium]|nr:rRNA maturation RNase YbeY [Flavobacteriales bacterium]
MIDFSYELDFKLENEEKSAEWISKCIVDFGKEEGELQYIFCDDAYLIKLNVEFLQHDTLTDIISFDYVMGDLISGDIFISIERVRENAMDLGLSFSEELDRVLIHGVLHYIGFKDKTEDEAKLMRSKEDYCLSLRA